MTVLWNVRVQGTIFAGGHTPMDARLVTYVQAASQAEAEALAVIWAQRCHRMAVLSVSAIEDGDPSNVWLVRYAVWSAPHGKFVVRHTRVLGPTDAADAVRQAHSELPARATILEVSPENPDPAKWRAID